MKVRIAAKPTVENSVHLTNVQSDPKAAEVPNLAYRFRRASQVIALLVATLGVVVLCGWAFNVPTLTYIRPPFQSMKVNTALSFLLLGAGLWLAHDDKQQRRRRILGLLVVIIAGATLVEYAFHVSLGIDQLLFRDTRTSLSAYPGRMATATALCFLFLGLAVTFLGTKKAIALQRALVGACFGVSLVALCGYLYGVESLYSITSFSTVAVHTAVGFQAACLAYFLARPNDGIVSIAASDSNSSLLLRALVPAIVGVPILIGWLRLAGQQARLYDTPFGVALQVLGSIGCLTAITLLIVRSMHRLERGQSRAEEAVRESEQRFRLVADTAPALIWMSGTDKLCTYFNKPWLDFTGRSMEQELGNGWAEGVHPDDSQRCLDTYQQSFDRREEFRMEYRLRHHDGEYRLILDIGVPRCNQDGSFAGYIGIAIDVTDRKQAEGTRARYAAIVQSSEDSIIATDVSGNVTDWNRGAERLFGYSAAEAVGKHVTLLSTPDRSEEVRGNTKKVLNGERVEQFETVRRRKDGTDIDVSLTISPIVDAAGRIMGMSGIARDISERKRAEETLRESEEWLRLAIQAGKMYAYEWDVTTDVLVRSPEHVNVLGATEPRTLTHQQVLERIHPEDRPKLVAAVARHSPENPTVGVTYRVLLPGKSPVWVKSSGRAFFDGEGRMLRVVGIVADITDQKLAEESLRASEERLRLAQEVAGIGTFERNIRTGVNTWTAEMESMYGLLPGSFGQTRTAFENLVHPNDRPEVIKLVERALKTGESTQGEWRVIWPDGSVHWIAGRWQALLDGSGEPSRVVGVNLDITARKRAEEALSGMTRKLVEAQEQERTRIARELHDDINQRLALLAIELELLRKHSPELPPETQQRVEQLREETTAISSDVQALSHDLHSSQLEYLGVVAGMKSWCKEFGERQGMQIDCGHDVRTILPQEIGLCLFRVLQEALHNAVKYSGVKRIEVQLREDFGEIHLIVRDSGRGFDIEAARQGRGLGLTSMHERVRLVNGTIIIESKPMGGTTIHVRVPVQSGHEAQRAAG